MNKRALTTYAIAEFCQVTPRTAIQWINEGKLKAYRTPGNHSRVAMEDFLDFLKKYNMPVPPELAAARGNDKKRILIVDDDEDMVYSMKSLLIREKIYALDAAYDGFQAGHKIAEFKPDLIISDIRMSGLDGYKLCAHIRGNLENRNVKILLISGYIGPEEVRKIKEAGADGYLAKPFRNEELQEKIAALLGGGVP